MHDGWVRNWRQIEDWEWYKTSNMAHLFQHLIRKANHRPKRWQGLLIETGQLVTSLTSLKLQTGISKQSLRTCLDHLKSTHEITLLSTHRYTLISICNYTTYQASGDATNTPPNTPTNTLSTQSQHSPNTVLTLNKNDKNDKNDKEVKKMGRFTPPSAEEVSAYAKQIDFALDGEGFVDFYKSKGWKVGKESMKDWKAAVRTWKKRRQDERTTKNRRNTGFDYENEPGSIEVRA